MALLTYKAYLEHAKAAFAYVRKTMVKGAANRFKDQPKGVPYLERRACVYDLVRPRTDALRTSTIKMELDRTRAELTGKMGKNWPSVITRRQLEEAGARTDSRIAWRTIEINAEYAAQFGCGNCEEQSSLTFRFLEKRGVKPLDWMAHDGYLTETGVGAHAFVIIGRDKATNPQKVSSWNREVVWCDPYENEIGDVKRIKERFEGKSMRLRYRLE